MKLGTAFIYSAAIRMHYRQIGCAKSVVNYRISKLLKPAFAANVVALYSHVLRVFHTTGLAAHTMGLVVHTIGLAALLEDGLVL
jgi:hypothetical protein